LRRIAKIGDQPFFDLILAMAGLFRREHEVLGVGSKLAQNGFAPLSRRDLRRTDDAVNEFLDESHQSLSKTAEIAPVRCCHCFSYSRAAFFPFAVSE